MAVVDHRAARSARFVAAHFWAPLFATLTLAAVLQLGQGDQAWADALYALQGHRWALQHAVVTEQVLHRLGRDLSALAWFTAIAAWGFARLRPGLAAWRRPLAYLWLTTLLAVALVTWLKSWSNMDCPWDLARYGGERAYVGLFELRPVGFPRAACFPAGHASGGYAWLALYFLALVTHPRWRWLGLAIGLGAGLAFGLAQQLRGAHFASHDLWTAAICWFTALGMHGLMLPGEPAVAGRLRAASGAMR